MSNIKIGNLIVVRALDELSTQVMENTLGSAGTITNIWGNLVQVLLPKHREHFVYHPSSLYVIGDPCSDGYQIGDFVKVKDGRNLYIMGREKKLDGHWGKIVDRREELFEVRMWWNGEHFNLAKDYLVPALDTHIREEYFEMPKDELRLGDVVRIKTGSRLKNKLATVTELNPRDHGEDYVGIREASYPYISATDYHAYKIDDLEKVNQDDVPIFRVKTVPNSPPVIEKKAKEASHKGLSPQYTYAATIVLASGREVSIPDPNPELWDPVQNDDYDVSGPGYQVRIEVRGGKKDFLLYAGDRVIYDVKHPEALCWIHDMERIVNEIYMPDCFTHRYSYIKEIRAFRERIIDAEFDDRPYPTLRAHLW